MRVNDEVAALLQEYADLLAITGGDAYRVRGYEKAARAVAGHSTDLARLDPDGIRAIPNVGTAIAAKIEEYLAGGSIPQVERLRAKIPAGVRELTRVPGLGPKTAMVLYEELDVASVDALEEAIRAGRLRGLRGFGPKTEENLLGGISLLREARERVSLGEALETAERVVAELSAIEGCRRCSYAGSLRRMKDTIGDIDVLAASRQSAPIMEAFRRLPLVDQVIASGETKTSVRTPSGARIDLRVVPPETWGAALQYFTGSKAHNIRLREIAVHRGLKLSEYGLFDAGTGEKLVSETEDDVYHRFGLPWIPPQLREDAGEIEAAQRGALPILVTGDEIRGDLHTHTDLTDGLAPLDEMVAAAANRGYAYYAVTDHAPDLYMHRMSDEKMLDQRERIRELDGAYNDMRVLHGTELNIGPGGEVDWPAEFLAGFDVCVASVHSHFTQPRAEMTRRFVRACENPHVKILGHPTTRIIGRRPPVDVDLEEVFRACARTGTALEIDGAPDRLDLMADHIRLARQFGVVFAVDSDAHAAPHLDFMRYGVGTAQRGGLGADDVINTWPWERLAGFLQRR
ncbi:DNA polymerase/3'-5' exonuclease PolX [Allosalinactinospora lopnorensis]|uniref:DNA polymerase/3'-5' exonuclease PolX n=1 Tax=Allosalinactinospora lopnorensis TaxID=1352348 RepID=UPI000623C1CF|nr:DNA polymerase/3'-5' exonuclease PolX [Allosalinactinospora lopnorensis]